MYRTILFSSILLITALTACGGPAATPTPARPTAVTQAFSPTATRPPAPPISAPTPVQLATATAAPAAAPLAGKSPCKGERPATRRTNYNLEEITQLDSSKNYQAEIEMVKGRIRLELYPKLAPQHVNSWVFLACQGFFDGLTFHRYEPGFVIQGGDPAGNGSGGPGYRLKAEFNPTLHTAGILSMARTSDPNSAGSQFFIMLGAAPHLDNQYTVFGKVTAGLDVVMQIRAGDKMTKVTVVEP